MANVSSAAALTSGNLLVSNSSDMTVREVTMDGSLVQSFVATAPNGAASGPRDVAVDSSGNIHFRNRVFDPVLARTVSYLSRIDPGTGTQTDQLGNFSSPSTGGRQNVAAIGNSVFVTDERTTGSEDIGLLRFTDAGTTRFAADFSPNDLTVGQNGRLYSLGNTNSSSSGTPDEIREFDPISLVQLNSITLPSATSTLGLTGLVGASDGSFFGVSLSDFVYQLNAGGTVISTLDLSATNPDLTDIDIDANGRMVIGSRFGEVFLTDTSLSSFTTFDTETTVYVGFTTPIAAVPEPGSFLAIGGIMFAALSPRTRRRQRVNP